MRPLTVAIRAALPLAALLAACTATPPGPTAMATRSDAPAVGTVLRDCPDCPELVVVPAGRFVMGITPAEAERMGAPGNRYVSWEQPQHEVTIGKALAMGRYPVTRDEYALFAAEAGQEVAGTLWQTPGIRQTGRDPVVKVSWTEAKAYIAWLSRKTGRSYRLPTEAEWEYAVRAGTTTPWWWGDEVGTANAVCDGCGTNWDGKGTAPVDAMPPNPWGLYDMLGNAFDMVEDCWNPSYEGAPSDGSAWLGGDCNLRVSRGGSWTLDPRFVRAGTRGRDKPDYRGAMVGFRVARDLP